MSESNSSSTNNAFNISGGSITNLTGSGAIYYNEAVQGIKANSTPVVNHTSATKTILFLAANPKGTSQLRLDEEMREIDAGLQRAQRREQFVLQQRWALRPRDVQRALLDYHPEIAHFSGHGGGGAGLVLEDETGTPKLVDTEALAALFELFSDRLECIILNACYSKVQAEAIARHVPYVIGMSQEIGDTAAIEFAVGFYDALGAGKSVEFAYKSGCVNIRMAGVAEYLTPVLIPKSATV
jgi:hypothetical protein